MSACPGSTDEIENGVAVIAPICDDIAAGSQLAQEFWNDFLVMCLTGGQDDPDGQPALVHYGMDLGAQSSTRETDGVILAPFLPPAAC